MRRMEGETEVTPEEMEEWPILMCGDCEFYKADADREGVESTCKRLDHKHLRFAKSPFKSYDCGRGMGTICKEFAPAARCKWLANNWDGLDSYLKENMIPRKPVPLVIDGDESVVYSVDFEDFFNGTFLNEDGSLRWTGKMYLKRCRKVPGVNTLGFRLVRERNEESNHNCNAYRNDDDADRREGSGSGDRKGRLHRCL